MADDKDITLAELAAEMREGFAHVDERFESLAQMVADGFSKADEKLELLAARLNYVESRLGRVEDGLTELTKTVSAEQEFTSDLRDDHAVRLRNIEKHLGLSP